MAKGDPLAREIMAVTGQNYTTALREKKIRWSERESNAYMLSVRALPPWTRGEPRRCVHCLAPEHGRRDCYV